LVAFNRKLAKGPTAAVINELKSGESGFVSKCDARIIGEVIRDLGGGRLSKDSQINHDVGVDQIAKPGERVEKSGVLCRVHAANSSDAKVSFERLQSAFEISATRREPPPLVCEIIR
jgi:thymidine phosphorylase